jgi:hypothetical protein
MSVLTMNKDRKKSEKWGKQWGKQIRYLEHFEATRLGS